MSLEFSAKAVSLAGLVEYQAGAVVSREVVKKLSGTVTVFAFDAGQGLSEHTTPFDALVYILRGSNNRRQDRCGRGGRYGHNACKRAPRA